MASRPLSVLLLMTLSACGAPEAEDQGSTRRPPPPTVETPEPEEAPARADDREDLTLYMPLTQSAAIHAAAMRLDVADSAILAAAWHAAADALDGSDVQPTLTEAPSAAVYFYVSRRIQDEVSARAEASDRSMSFLFLKAWEMSRAEIEALETRDAFHAWVRANIARREATADAP